VAIAAAHQRMWNWYLVSR